MTSDFTNKDTTMLTSSDSDDSSIPAKTNTGVGVDCPMISLASGTHQGSTATSLTASGIGSSMTLPLHPEDFSAATNSRVNFTMTSESGFHLPLTSYWEYDNASTPNEDEESPTAPSRPDGTYTDPVDLLCSHPKKPSILKKWDQGSNSATTQCVSFEIDLVDEPLRRTKSSESNLSFDSETGYWSEMSDQSSPGGILKHGLSSSSGGSLGSSRRSSEDFSKVDGEGKSILRRSSLGSTSSSESGLQSILKRKLSDTTSAGTEFRFNRSYSSVSLPETKTILKSSESLNDVEAVQLKPILKKSSDEGQSSEYCRIRPILKKNSRNQRSSSTGSILKTTGRRSTHGILKNSGNHYQASNHCRLSLEDAMDRTDSEEDLLLTLSVAERTSLFMQYEMEGSGLARHSTSTTKCVKGRGRASTQPITTVEMLRALSIKAAEERINSGSVNERVVKSPCLPADKAGECASVMERVTRSPEPERPVSRSSDENEGDSDPEAQILQRSDSPLVKFNCPETDKLSVKSQPEPCPKTDCCLSQELECSHNTAIYAQRRQSVPTIINYFHGTAPEIRRIPPNDPESFVQFFSSPGTSLGEERVDDASFASVVQTGRRVLLGTRRSVRVTRKHRSTTNPIKSSQRICKQYYLQPSAN